MVRGIAQRAARGITSEMVNLIKEAVVRVHVAKVDGPVNIESIQDILASPFDKYRSARETSRCYSLFMRKSQRSRQS